MDYNDGGEMNRSIWEFQYKAEVLAEAAEAKQAFRKKRIAWWEEQKEGVMAEIRESGIEISESLAQTYMSNAGRAPQVGIRADLQTKLQECHAKIQSHMKAAREYDGWAQVLNANPDAILPLKHSDWLFFFGRD